MPNIAAPSVMSLLIRMRFNGQQLASGTSFVVQAKNGPVLITNRHNVTGRHQGSGEPLSPTCGVPNEIVIIHNHDSRLGAWIECVEPLYDGDVPRWKEHPVLGARADIVALPLRNLNHVKVYPYEFHGPAIAARTADVVSVIGFPFGLTAGGAFAVWATGFIASEPQIDFDDLSVFLIDCRSRQGQSGSPVVAYRSGGAVSMEDGSTVMYGGPVFRLLGIYSGRINAESDLGIVWRESAIHELIKAL